jgi:FtsZ-binding cell division protein ZapB
MTVEEHAHVQDLEGKVKRYRSRIVETKEKNARLTAERDALALQLDATQRHVEALREKHRQFICALLQEKCGTSDTVYVERALYDAYECEVVVALERFTSALNLTPATEQSLMYRATRIYPPPKDLQVTQR